MKQRFLSIFTVVALMASVLAGAMGVSVSSAIANGSAASGDAYLNDIYTELASSGAFNTTDLFNWFDTVNTIVENDSNDYFVVALEEDGNWLITVYQFRWDVSQRSLYTFYTSYNSVSGVSWFGNSNSNWNYCEFNRIARLKYVDGWGYFDNVTTSVQLYEDHAYTWVKNQTSSSDIAVPSYYEYSRSGRNVYCSKPLSSGQNSSYSFSVNLFAGSPEPEYILFNVTTFYVGERLYFTFLEQDVFRDMMPDHMDYMLGVFADGSDDSDFFTWEEDVVLLPGAQNFIAQPFSNVSPAGIYAIEISFKDWVVIDMVNLIEFDSDFSSSYAGYAINCPYRVVPEPGTNGQPDSYTQVFNYFNEYANNYNTTHFVPENLADSLFGLNGSKMYPCSVSVPKSVWNNNSTGAANQLSDQHNWKWWFASRSNLGINFELMDVVILSESANGQYSLLYYYSDTLNNPFQYVQNLSLQDVFENFDIVILVPDDLGCLEGNTWWKQLLESICQNLGISNLSSSLLSSLAISGSDSLGVEYVDSQPSDVAGVLQGFCIVTKKAIQRQQLYVFNEGITKTYELMSNYLDERGKWEDSFLDWTIGLFYQWQTLDGKLGDIYNLLYGWNLSSVLSDISESLARIAANTSEEDPGYWFLSLFNWLNRFSVTDSDFANWVSEYDDFTDDLPDPGTGATVIPFPTAIPTVAVGG